MLPWFCVALFAILPIGCGDPKSDIFGQETKTQLIIGGDAADAGQFSAVAMLDSGCTGVIVHPHYLATAAHCVRGAAPQRAYLDNELMVEFEDDSLSIDKESATKSVEIESCVLHPQAEEPGFDLAVCKLEEAADVSPIRLAQTGAEEGERVVLVGYGFDQVGGEAGTKRYVESSVSGITTDTDGQELVIGNHQQGTCRGDSGGPAFRLADNGENLGLVGILSGGESGRCGFGWYTNVPLRLSWLNEVTQHALATETVMPDADEPHNLRAAGCGVTGRDSTDQGLSAWFLLVIGALMLEVRRFIGQFR